jgi:hypothetical protein
LFLIVPQAMVAEGENVIRVISAAASKLFEGKYSVDVQGREGQYSSSSYMLLHEYLGRA